MIDMKFILPFSLLVAALFIGTSCDSQTSAGDAKRISKDVDVTTFSQYIKTMPGAQLLDVRTPGETAQGIIAGATEIDINDPAFAQKVAKLDKNKPVLVYCRSGARSGSAMRQMAGLGFTQVYNLAGGIMAWQGSRQPVVRK